METTAQVGVTTVTMPSDREIVVTHVVDAPRDLVWDAWTKPEHMPNWMLGPPGWTMPVCEMDLRPEGSWHFVWRDGAGNEMAMRGVYREIVPPERLVSTESWGAGWPETLNTLTFREEAGKTTVTVSILYPSQEARDRAAQTGMTGGMDATFERLAEYIRTNL